MLSRETFRPKGNACLATVKTSCGSGWIYRLQENASCMDAEQVVVTISHSNNYLNILFSVSIECAKGLHLYNDRCYAHCPDSTYASEMSTRSSRRRNLTYFSESTVMKRQGGSTTALEAIDLEPGLKTPLTCLPCHYTCATCVGPHNNQCTSCLEDAQLFNLTDTEPKLYCYPNSVLSQINDANWHYRLNVALSVVLFVISFVSLYFLVSFLFKRYCCGGYYASNMKGTYNKLAVDDKQHSALEVENEICKALKDYSDSESEDDLDL